MKEKKTRKWMVLFSALTGLVVIIIGITVLAGKRRKPNLILIVIDTLRADHLSCYGYERIRTPNIDNLASQGLLVENAVSHINVTLPSFSTIMTSTLPPTNGVHYNEGFYLDESAQTLAEILEGEGYSTGAVLGAVVLDSINGISQGFSSYDDNFGEFTGYRHFIKLMEKQLSYTQRRAEEVTDLGLNLAVSLAEESPFFLFLHYFDPHSPYDPPPPYSVVDPALREGSNEIITQRYDGEIAYTDEHIGRLLQSLEDRDLLENTLVVLTSDHGESLGEHEERSHGYYAYEGTIHVPLIFSWPEKLPAGEVYSGLASHIDLAPTILDILGFDSTIGRNFQGGSLYPFDSGQASGFSYLESAMTYIVFNWGALRGVRSAGWKYIAAPREELYDLVADPREVMNLIDRMPHVADSLRGALDNIVSGIDIYQGEEAGQEMSSGQGGRQENPEFKERLRALGYIGAPDVVISGYEEMFDPSLPDPKEKMEDYNLVLKSSLNMRLGIAYAEMDSFEKAISHLNDAIQEYPDNGEAYFYLGLVSGEMGKYKKAEEYFRLVPGMNPSHRKARLALVDLYMVQGDSARARLELEGVFSIGIEESKELVLGARLWERLGDRDRAVGAMVSSLEIAKGQFAARLYLGELYLLEDRYKEAFPYLEQLTAELSGRDSLATRVYYGLGRCYSNRGDFEKAGELFQKVITLDSTSADGYNQLGLIYDNLGEYEKAIEYYRKALSFDEDMFEVHSNLGVANYQLGRYRESREEFETYLPHAENEEEELRLKTFIEHIKTLE